MLKFLIGIGCGVGLGLLIAPARGEETREQLMELASHPADVARQKVQEVRENIAQMGAELGRQMAEGLAEMGADVVLCARKKERCEEAARDLATLGVKTAALGCDVKDPASVQKMVDDSVSQFGRIDILINNAGISWGALVEKMTLEEWNKVIETNLTGTFLCSQAAGKVMIRQGGGKIINVASVAGLRGAPPDTVNAIAYHASKGGVISFTKDLAWKWAQHNIQVNAICPGFFVTPINARMFERNSEQILREIPLARTGGDDDLKGIALLLASDASNFMTGAVIPVDGGSTAW